MGDIVVGAARSRLSMDSIHPGRAFHAVWMHEVSRPTADKVDHCFLAPIWFHGSSKYSLAVLLILSARIFQLPLLGYSQVQLGGSCLVVSNLSSHPFGGLLL